MKHPDSEIDQLESTYQLDIIFNRLTSNIDLTYDEHSGCRPRGRILFCLPLWLSDMGGDDFSPWESGPANKSVAPLWREATNEQVVSPSRLKDKVVGSSEAGVPILPTSTLPIEEVDR